MLERQAPGYLMVGLVQLGLDALLFVGLTLIGVHTAVANVISRLVGASVGFLANGQFTFAVPDRRWSIRRSLPRFTTVWLASTAVGTLAVWAVDHHGSLGWAWIAKPVVDAALAIAGFVLSRHWIYR